MTTTVFNRKINEVENKIQNSSNLVTTTVLNTKISEVENKILHHANYITTPEFNKLTAKSFAKRLKQVNLVSKTNFDNKVISFVRKITSSKTKYLEVQKKVNSLITKDYNFSSGRICFTSNDGSQNIKPTLDTLKLKKTKVLIMFLAGNMVLMEAWDHQRKSLILILVKQTQNFA